MNRIILPAVSFFFSTISISQSWEVIPVDKGGDGETEIHTEVSGDEIHYLCKGGWNELFYYYSGDKGRSWELQKTLKIEHRTFEIGEISTALDKDRLYHMVYF